MSSYYGRPILKQPVWKPEVALYFFTGGLAGASGLLAFLAGRLGNRRLHRAALLSATGGALVSPVLLTVDLGRPERFHHMLRVFKPTSPMSVGSWILAGFSGSSTAALGSDLLGVLRPAGIAAETTAAVLGPALATYTAALIADTAIPAWHEAREELPFVFAGGAAASAGAMATLLTPPQDAGPARRLAVFGALLETAAATVMKRRLRKLAQVYEEVEVRQLDRAAQILGVGGAAGLALTGRRRLPASVFAGCLVAGALCQRFAIFRAGFESARQTTGEGPVGPAPRQEPLRRPVETERAPEMSLAGRAGTTPSA